ncbi:hypothetical protein IAT40_002428 [Kwoniella sp. CBS 6097]
MVACSVAYGVVLVVREEEEEGEFELCIFDITSGEKSCLSTYLIEDGVGIPPSDGYPRITMGPRGTACLTYVNLVILIDIPTARIVAEQPLPFEGTLWQATFVGDDMLVVVANRREPMPLGSDQVPAYEEYDCLLIYDITRFRAGGLAGLDVTHGLLAIFRIPQTKCDVSDTAATQIPAYPLEDKIFGLTSLQPGLHGRSNILHLILETPQIHYMTTWFGVRVVVPEDLLRQYVAQWSESKVQDRQRCASHQGKALKNKTYEPLKLPIDPREWMEDAWCEVVLWEPPSTDQLASGSKVLDFELVIPPNPTSSKQPELDLITPTTDQNARPDMADAEYQVVVRDFNLCSQGVDLTKTLGGMGRPVELPELADRRRKVEPRDFSSRVLDINSGSEGRKHGGHVEFRGRLRNPEVRVPDQRATFFDGEKVLVQHEDGKVVVFDFTD